MFSAFMGELGLLQMISAISFLMGLLTASIGLSQISAAITAGKPAARPRVDLSGGRPESAAQPVHVHQPRGQLVRPDHSLGHLSDRSRHRFAVSCMVNTVQGTRLTGPIDNPIPCSHVPA